MHGRLRIGACTAAVAAAALAVTAAAPMAGIAHAQDDEDGYGAIPEWVRIVFGYYADGSISDVELLAALQYLADQGILVISPAPAAEPPAPAAMSDEAEWAADEARLEDAIAVRLRDDMQAFRVELRAGAYIPGEPADYDKAVEAGRAEIKAVEAYAGTLRTAAADGRITAAEKKAIEDAGRAADDAAAASYEAFMATPMAPLLEFSGGMMDMFAGAMAGTGGASIDLSMPPPPASQAPATNAPAPPRSVATAGEASDEADYLADLAKNQRKHLRNFELGLAGSDYRTTGDFGSAGSSAASAAGGNIAAYNPMIDAIREAIRASERLASVLEDAAEDGSISAAESDAIAGAYAAADEAGTAAAAAYDATPYARHSPYGTFASFMDGFR